MFIYRGYQVKNKVKAAKKVQNSLLLQLKVSIGTKYGSVKDSAVKFACRMGFLAVVDQMV